MHIKLFPLLVLLSLGVGACISSKGQPVFSSKQLPGATPIPDRPNPRVVATLAQRIDSFDVSPDGEVIALATTGGVKLYEISSCRYIRGLNEGEPSAAVAWSPDGRKLAIGSTKDYGTPFYEGGDSTNSAKAHLVVWDTSAWKIAFEPHWGNEMVNQRFRDIAWSPDGRLLAFSLDTGGVWVYDVQTGKNVSHQADFASTVTSISWSPDGSRLAASSDTAYGIRRWRISDDGAVRLFDPRVSASDALAWSPDGNRIASGHYLGGVCLWTAATNRCDGFIQAHRTATFSLAWSPDSSELATGGGVIRIWDAHTGKLVTAFGEQSGYMYSRMEWLSPSGPIISLESSFDNPGDTAVRIWDLRAGSTAAEIRGIEAAK